MSERHTRKPSPLAGEGAERTRSGREAGEGAFEKRPSPGRSLRSRPPSPARGEGSAPAARANHSASPVAFARKLRAKMTDAERRLWFALRDRRFANFKFRRQVPVGSYVADFICYDARLIVEADGGQHADSVSDQVRDRWFRDNGFRVLRFWNNDILRNLDGVLTVILTDLSGSETRP